jgi:hypothetical protein
VLRLTEVPAVLVEGGFLTERGESRLIAKKEWRGKLAQAISVGIENYRSLAVKKQRPMLVADFRRQGKSLPVEPTEPIERVPQEIDSSLVELIGESEFSSPTPASTPPPASSLEAAVIVP